MNTHPELKNDKDSVKLTPAAFWLICYFQDYKQLQITKGILNEKLGVRKSNWLEDCKEHFDLMADPLKKHGFALNAQTFNAIIMNEIPETFFGLEPAYIEKCFVFNPWAGMGKGGFVQVDFEPVDTSSLTKEDKLAGVS